MLPPGTPTDHILGSDGPTVGVVAHGDPRHRTRWTAAPPPDAPYHRLARTGHHRPWRPVVGVLTLVPLAFAWCIVAFVVGMGLAITAGVEQAPPGSDLLFADPLWDEAVLLGGIAAMIPVVLLHAVVVDRRRVGSVLSVTGRLRLRWLGWCALVATASLGAPLAVLDLFDGSDPSATGWVGADRLAVSLLVLVPLVPLQSAAEEVLARGYLLQAVGSLARSPWPGILVGGAIWTAAHSPSTAWGVADLMLFSAVTGWLTVRTGGLEAAIAVHAVNNLTSFTVLAAIGGLGGEGTAGDATWQVLVFDGPALPIYALVVLVLHRRFRLAARTPSAPAAGS